MKWSTLTAGILGLGLIGLSIILLFQDITTSNENDYYLLKEAMEASMIDSIDIPYYRDSGKIKIVKEKFVENFTRRYAESTLFVGSEYKIKFYDIIEMPPKATITIDNGLGQHSINGNVADYNVKNRLDGILEAIGKETYGDPNINPYVKKTFVKDYTAIVPLSNSAINKILSVKEPEELLAYNHKNLKIEKIEAIENIDRQDMLNKALMESEIFYFNNKVDNYMQFISDYSTNNNINVEYYNCGASKDKYKCDEKNKHYIKFTGSGKSKNKAALKYKITWSYEEYELKNN